MTTRRAFLLGGSAAVATLALPAPRIVTLGVDVQRAGFVTGAMAYRDYNGWVAIMRQIELERVRAEALWLWRSQK